MLAAVADPRLEAVISWAAGALGVSALAKPAMQACAELRVDATTAGTPWAQRQWRTGEAWAAAPGGTVLGFEFHHDGSARVDLSVLVPAPEGRVRTFAQASFILGVGDFHEFDVIDGRARAVAVFHPVVGAELPAWLGAWGEPRLVAVMHGRSGQLRMILPVPDPAALSRIADQLARSGHPGAGRLPATAPLLTGSEAVRLALEFVPGKRHPGPRLGLEVFGDPRPPEYATALVALGVPPGQVRSLLEQAAGLPIGRRYRVQVPGLPGIQLAPRAQGLGYSHLSVSWSDGPAVLKSYVMLRDGPAAG